jgi:hypothetical protein
LKNICNYDQTLHTLFVPTNKLFILVLELLSAAIKNDPEITGVKINDSEYLLSQYADDRFRQIKTNTQ